MAADNFRIEYDYSKRINIVIDYIDANLEHDLPLNRLAQKAHFSIFHFLRVFTLVTGETPNAFICRKRIERIASHLLVGMDESLNDLAFRFGFSNGNALSRAFRKFYGVTPSTFRTHFSKIGVNVLSYERYICRVNKLKVK